MYIHVNKLPRRLAITCIANLFFIACATGSETQTEISKEINYQYPLLREKAQLAVTAGNDPISINQALSQGCSIISLIYRACEKEPAAQGKRKEIRLIEKNRRRVEKWISIVLALQIPMSMEFTSSESLFLAIYNAGHSDAFSEVAKRRKKELASDPEYLSESLSTREQDEVMFRFINSISLESELTILQKLGSIYQGIVKYDSK